jgi:hypothetical protein
MKRRSRSVALVSACAIVAAAAVILVAVLPGRPATLEFTVRDAVSRRWVWGAVMRAQERTIVGFFQTDAGLKTYRFTRLSPGPTTLTIDAPGYRPVAVPLSLHRGVNRRGEPIDMVGLGIPDLSKIFVFEKLEGRDIVAQLRPVSGSGGAIINHPAMDLWVGCRVSVQVKGGAPVIEETEEGSVHGRELFRGQIPWTWDPAPETQFRYSARIPGTGIADDPSNYRVIDYLIVQPDPLKITHAELADLMTRIYAITDPEAMIAALDAEKSRLRYFVDVSWNVRARQQ